MKVIVSCSELNLDEEEKRKHNGFSIHKDNDKKKKIERKRKGSNLEEGEKLNDRKFYKFREIYDHFSIVICESLLQI